jgi:RimJ/RimL family protein N-acetyltransferase
MNLPDRIPELLTPRLALRAATPADAAALLAIFSDPGVMRYWSTLPWAGLQTPRRTWPGPRPSGRRERRCGGQWTSKRVTARWGP